jgi:hypothetical protein
MVIKLNINLKINIYLKQLFLKKQTKINNAIHFSTNPILNHKIEKK